ncbi:MAG: HAD family phosphatase [Bifidobacteriaceae bacterium]|jgi:HAD superfamily hydrolase (TIGR01509 family)|nr:HAD family phosphatase [Bifidobacteriaceae bacterium]
MTGSLHLKGVLWDLDGTLVDSEPAWFAAEAALVRQWGGSWSQAQSEALTGSALHRTAGVLREAGVAMETEPLIETLLRSVADYVKRNQAWMPGAVAALRSCREAGLKCALVSMSWSLFTSEIEAMLPDMFNCVISGDQVTRGKPHPDAYLLAAARLGLEPAECIAIEDSPTGVASALAAGIPTVAIPALVEITPAPGLTIVPSAELLTPATLKAIHSSHTAP